MTTETIAPASHAITDKTLAKLTKAVNAKAARIEKKLGEAQKDVISLGKDYAAIREYIQENAIPGGFRGWIENHSGRSKSHVYSLIDTAEKFANCPNIGHYHPTATYLLADAPEAARAEAEQVAESGFVSYTAAKEIVAKHKTATDQAEDSTTTEEGKSKGKSRKKGKPKWSEDCHGLKVTVSGDGAGSLSNVENALVAALVLVRKHKTDASTEARLPPPGTAVGPLEEEIEVDGEGNVIRR